MLPEASGGEDEERRRILYQEYRQTASVSTLFPLTYISNCSDLERYINDKEVQSGKKRHLRDGCIIRMSDVHFIFEINKGAVNKIKRQLQV